MSKDLNSCSFIGRLGKDIELKYSASGSAIANFSIACGDDYKNKDGQKVEQTNWINCVAFGKSAEILGEWCKKGSQLYISGKQSTRKWQDQNGNDRYTTEITVQNFQFLGGRADSSSGDSKPAQKTASIKDLVNNPPTDDSFDSIPF